MERIEAAKASYDHEEQHVFSADGKVVDMNRFNHLNRDAKRACELKKSKIDQVLGCAKVTSLSPTNAKATNKRRMTRV